MVTPQDKSGINFSVGSDSAPLRYLTNGSKISRVATLKGTALTAAQVKAEYERWVTCDEANTYARMYGGPDPEAAGLSKASGTLTQGTWGTENADEFSYQAYAIRYNTAAGNPGDFDNSTNLLRRTGTWANTAGYAVNAPVAGGTLTTNGGFDADTDWTKGAGWSISGGVAVAAGATSDRIYQEIAEVIGIWYRMDYTVVTLTAGGTYPYMGAITTQVQVGTGAKKFTGRMTGAGSSGVYGAGGGFTGTIDNISIKPLPLNQLLQLTAHTGTPDVYAEVELSVVATGFQAGIALNWDSPTNPQNGVLIYLNRNDDKVYVDRCVGGTWTNEMAGVAVIYAAGAKLAIRKIGSAANNLYVWYNNIYVGVCTSNTVNPSTTDVIHHGIFATGASATETKLDLWRCYPSGSNSEYALLDMFIN